MWVSSGFSGFFPSLKDVSRSVVCVERTSAWFPEPGLASIGKDRLWKKFPEKQGILDKLAQLMEDTNILFP